jgi:hypothetical protein
MIRPPCLPPASRRVVAWDSRPAECIMGAIKEAHFQLVLYRNGRNLNLRAADQTRNLHRGSCWLGIRH